MVAEFESDLIRLRTVEGMKVAKAKGPTPQRNAGVPRRQQDEGGLSGVRHRAHAPVLPSTPSRSRSTWPQCWAYSVIIRSTSQTQIDVLVPIQRARGVVEVVSGDDLTGNRTLRAPVLQVGGEVGVRGRVEVEVGVVCGEEEDRHVAALEVLLEPPALDAGEVSDQAVKRQVGRRHGPGPGLLPGQVAALHFHRRPVVL